MDNHQQQQPVDLRERNKKFRDILRQSGFTGNVPFTLNYRSLPSDEKKKIIDETKAIFAHIFNIAPNDLPALFRLMNTEDTSNDVNIQGSGGH